MMRPEENGLLNRRWICKTRWTSPLACFPSPRLVRRSRCQCLHLPAKPMRDTGCLFLDKAGNRKLARECNEYSAAVQAAHPTRFSFYANLPDVFLDLEGALEELRFAYDVLGAEGVCLFPQYDGNYLGHSACVASSIS